jgi:hypothetical protein
MLTGLEIYTLFHTLISLLAILAGIVVVRGLLASRIDPTWTRAFLVLAIATSVTGYFFPFHGVTPAQIVGVVALVILAVVLLARRRFHLAGSWRWIYAAGMATSLYLLVFVLVAQSFEHVPFLNPLAPTGSEPPFKVAQAVVLVAFVVIGVLAARRFRPAAA